MAINYAVEYPLLQRRLADYGKQVHHWKSRCEELEEENQWLKEQLAESEQELTALLESEGLLEKTDE